MAVTGPRDLAPLARAAAARRSEVGRVGIMGSRFIWPYCAPGYGRFLVQGMVRAIVFSGLAAKIKWESV